MKVRSPRKKEVPFNSIVLLGFILWGVCLFLNVLLLVSQTTLTTNIIITTTVTNDITSLKRNLSNQRNTIQGKDAILEPNIAGENQGSIFGKSRLVDELGTRGGQLQLSQEEKSETSVKNQELSSSFTKKSTDVTISKENSHFVNCQGFNHSTLRPMHGCQVNDDSRLVYCNFQNLRIDVSKIEMDRGGEPLKDVMGREEDKEFPIYEIGAFSVNEEPKFELPIGGAVGALYTDNVINYMSYPTVDKNHGNVETSCVETWSGTTLFITRYEYVNLYHALTDWWNAYFVMPPDNHSVRVVFLDAHAQGSLDPVWETVFGKFTYVKHLPEGGVCFENAVFIPPGYRATIVPISNINRKSCPLRKRADDFSEHVLRSYGLNSVKPVHGKVVIIDRVPYVSHPRSKPQSLQRVITNLDELKRQLGRIKNVTSVETVQLETMSFKEQLEAVREAHILIGNHGAGLSHLFFMDRKSHVLEFSLGSQNLFGYLSDWNGVQLHTVRLEENTQLSQSELATTIDTVEGILNK